MKTKGVICVIIATIVSAICVSCTNEKQIVEVAEKYVSEQICPLLPNASISDYAPAKPVDPVSKIKGGINKQKLVNVKDESLLETKRFAALYVIQSYEEYRCRLILQNLMQSDIDALGKADAEQGFYLVWVNIKYNNDKYQSFDIVVSKDMKVLNAPIDISDINQRAEKIKDSLVKQ